MPELRSLSTRGVWHIINNDTVSCAIQQRALYKLRSSDAIRTEITEAELQAALTTNTFLYHDNPVKICTKCVAVIQDATNVTTSRTFTTLRLLNDDFHKLQDIGRLTKQSRHQALCKLAPIVRELALPDQRKKQRQSLRIGIPSELDEAIRKSAERNNCSYLTILISAVHEYHHNKQHPS